MPHLREFGYEAGPDDDGVPLRGAPACFGVHGDEERSRGGSSIPEGERRALTPSPLAALTRD